MNEKPSYRELVKQRYFEGVEYSFEHLRLLANPKEFFKSSFKRTGKKDKIIGAGLWFGCVIATFIVLQITWLFSEFSIWGLSVMMLNIFNVINFNNGIGRLGYPISLVHRGWTTYAGENIQVDVHEPQSDGYFSNCHLIERLRWCFENVAEGDWTYNDEWASIRVLKELVGPVRVSYDFGFKFVFIFRKREDAMIFKLTFGGQSA